MEKYRNKKILTMIVLVVAIVGLSVGFAAFSSVLTISSEVSVDPDSSTFSVKFSKVAGSIADGEDNLIYPTGDGEAALINNTSDPTLTGLKANFTAPGQSVVYRLYVMNTGEYLAYLNGVQIFPKSCVAGDGTNPTLVQNACDSISVSVKIGTMDEITESNTNITNHTLAAGAYEEVIVTINYASNGAVADGAFDVNFGDIKLTYSTITGFDVPDAGEKVCTLSTESTGDEYTTGTTLSTTEVVTCGSEQFYVMERTSSTITMLAKYNLGLSASPYLQSATNAGTIVWGFETTDEVTYWPSEGEYIYDTMDNPIKPIVEEYKNYLINTLGVSNASAKLMSLEQAESICNGWDCSSNAPWMSSTNYWLGNIDTCDVGFCNVRAIRYGYIDYHGLVSGDGNLGIRPVVTISTSQVNM